MRMFLLQKQSGMRRKRSENGECFPKRLHLLLLLILPFPKKACPSPENLYVCMCVGVWCVCMYILNLQSLFYFKLYKSPTCFLKYLKSIGLLGTCIEKRYILQTYESLFKKIRIFIMVNRYKIKK